MKSLYFVFLSFIVCSCESPYTVVHRHHYHYEPSLHESNPIVEESVAESLEGTVKESVSPLPPEVTLLEDPNLVGEGDSPNAVESEIAGYYEAPAHSSIPLDESELSPEYYEVVLEPHGEWVEVESYGQCWQPHVTAHDPEWRPYCDNGQWLHTDHGWYWQSNYSWGHVPFHYGRWYRSHRHGWVWQPGKIWGPAWVSWRESERYCGWAPLPPQANYVPRVGFHYYGWRVDDSCSYGLGYDDYAFVDKVHFYGAIRRQNYCSRGEVREIFLRSKVVHNYSVHADKIIINKGVDVEDIARSARKEIPKMKISSLFDKKTVKIKAKVQSGIRAPRIGDRRKHIGVSKSITNNIVSKGSASRNSHKIRVVGKDASVEPKPSLERSLKASSRLGHSQASANGVRNVRIGEMTNYYNKADRERRVRELMEGRERNERSRLAQEKVKDATYIDKNKRHSMYRNATPGNASRNNITVGSRVTQSKNMSVSQVPPVSYSSSRISRRNTNTVKRIESKTQVKRSSASSSKTLSGSRVKRSTVSTLPPAPVQGYSPPVRSSSRSKTISSRSVTNSRPATVSSRTKVSSKSSSRPAVHSYSPPPRPPRSGSASTVRSSSIPRSTNPSRGASHSKSTGGSRSTSTPSKSKSLSSSRTISTPVKSARSKR